MSAGCAADAGQRERIAGEAHVGGIDHRLAARAPEQRDLVLGRLLVEQPEVVEVGVEVLAHPADVRQVHRLVGEALVAGGGRLPEHHPEVDQQVLVRQRDAHRLGLDGSEDGERLSRKRLGHGLHEGSRAPPTHDSRRR
jgi:hypothetical protein